MAIELPYARWKREYNLNPEQADKLFRAQKGLCYTCAKPFSRTRFPCVDHEHTTGLVRGLLCSPCNDAIGFRHDNAGWFIRVGNHLINPIAQRIIGDVYVPNSPGAAGATRRASQ